jgi:hypothetical protein
MLGAPLYFDALGTCSIAVTAAGAAGAIVMSDQCDAAERAEPFRHVSHGGARLAVEIHRPVKSEPMFGNYV